MAEKLEKLFNSKYPHASFHDSILKKITLDYIAQKANLDFDIGIGEPDSEQQEEYRSGCLVFSGLISFSIEPPRANYNSKDIEGLWVSDYEMIDLQEVLSKTKLLSIPEDIIAVRFFVNDWNAYIYAIAEMVFFEWT